MATRRGPGREPMADPAPLVEVEGPPAVRGRQYGRAAGARIARGIGHYREQLARQGFDDTALARAVGLLLPRIEAFESSFVPEMRAIAEGAGQPFEHIVLLNARTEILQLAARQKAARAAEARGAAGAPGGLGATDDDPDGCTGVVVLPEAAGEGRLIHAQNWDWKAECAETAVVLKVHAFPEPGSESGAEPGPDLLTFTEAGALGRCGFNADGIAITANYLECDRDGRHEGVPLALIRRKVLMQRHLALAMRAVAVTPKSASNNMIVSHAQGLAIDFECAPDESFQVHAEDGLLVHANHWLSPVALAKLRETGITSTPDSLYRDLRVRQLLGAQRGRIGAAEVKAALFDRFGGEWAVCRPPRRNLSNNLSASVAMIVMTPALGQMQVAMLPALDRRFTTYRLDTRFRPVEPVSPASLQQESPA
jgi:isopenicillin-N N-acyltransferase-like protein